jgi:hypothetical protein
MQVLVLEMPDEIPDRGDLAAFLSATVELGTLRLWVTLKYVLT